MDSNSINAPRYIRVYTTLANVKTGMAAEKNNYGSCRAIRCEADGVLAVKATANDSFQALNFKAGETQLLQCVDIDTAASSGCVPIALFW